MGQQPETAIGRMDAFAWRHVVPLSFGVVASLVAGEAAVAVAHSGDDQPAAVNVIDASPHHQLLTETRAQATVGSPQLAAESTPNSIPNVPAAAYSGALLISHNNIVEADSRLITLGLPPVPTDALRTLNHSLHLHLGHDQMSTADEIDTKWQSVAAENDMPEVKDSVSVMFASMNHHEQWQIRHNIKEVLDEEYARNVVENPWGANRGPRVDFYNRYHLLHHVLKTVASREWCATSASTDYKLAGIPLSGGKTYTKHTPDYLLSQAYGPLNPDEKHPVVSLADWFKKYATYYHKGERTPEVGDAYFKRYPLINDKTGQVVRNQNGKIEYEYHTGIVYAVYGTTLVTQDGNVGNRLTRVPHYNYMHDSSVFGFGSLFPRQPQPVKKHHHPKSPSPSPTPSPEGPIQQLLDDISKLLPPKH